MKPSRIPALHFLAVLITALELLGCKAQSTQVSQERILIQPAVTNVLTNAANPNPSVNLAETAIAPDATNQAVAAKTFGEKLLSGEARLSEGAAGIVSLAQGGVGEEVLLAYVQNHPAPFNLTAEEILYLTDLGISEAVISAMIKHSGGKAGVAESGTPPSTNNVPVPPSVAAGNQPPLPPAGANPVVVAPNAPSFSVTATPEFEAGIQPAPVVEIASVPPVQYNYFYSSLAPYGSWIDVPDYGLCWQPTVAVVDFSWRPYGHRGRWIYSNYGWYWHSDYSWGWAPFHYGRWRNYPSRGWLWVPDVTWGPAWVTWRYSDAYCGWAPLPPGARFVEGIGFSYRSSHVGISFDFGLGTDCYTFIPTSRFCDPFPWRHRLAGPQVVNVFNRTTVINNYVQGSNNTIIHEGIDRRRIAAITRSEVQKVAVRDLPPNTIRSAKPDRLERSGSEMVVYRPALPAASPEVPTTRNAQEIRKPAAPGARNGPTGPANSNAASPAASGGDGLRRSETVGKTGIQPAMGGIESKASSLSATIIPSSRNRPSTQTASRNADAPPTFRSGDERRESASVETQRTETPARLLLRRDPRSVGITPLTAQSQSSEPTPPANPPSQPANNVDVRSRNSVLRPKTDLESRLVEIQSSNRATTPPNGQSPAHNPPVLRSRGLTQQSSAPSAFALQPQNPYAFPTPPSSVPPVSSYAPQPVTQTAPAPQYRQELPRPPSANYRERQNYSQPAPNRNPEPQPAYSAPQPAYSAPQPRNSAPSRGVSEYTPPSRPSLPRSGSISSVPSSRQGPPPSQVQPSQVTPSPRSSSSSENSVPSRSSGSSEGRRQQEK